MNFSFTSVAAAANSRFSLCAQTEQILEETQLHKKSPERHFCDCGGATGGVHMTSTCFFTRVKTVKKLHKCTETRGKRERDSGGKTTERTFERVSGAFRAEHKHTETVGCWLK